MILVVTCLVPLHLLDRWSSNGLGSMMVCLDTLRDSLSLLIFEIFWGNGMPNGLVVHNDNMIRMMKVVRRQNLVAGANKLNVQLAGAAQARSHWP